MDFTKVKENLEKNGYAVRIFATAEEAASALTAELAGKSVGFGGSMTLEAMGLYDRLKPSCPVYWHWKQDLPRKEALLGAMTADVYLLSANGLSETGEIVNIDGTGNRVAAALYGHEKVIFVVGRNKLSPTEEAAMERARNVAAPLNARRLHCATPCAANADRCYDCASPGRICNVVSVLWKAPGGCPCEVILIDEDLGY